MRNYGIRARRFTNELISWYSTHARSFPWRRTRNPYRVLIAEIFLQKTQAKQVRPIYERFIRDFPTPSALAEAPIRKIGDATWSLGLLSRSAQLKTMARTLVDKFSGRTPDTERELLSLKGVGAYTANAVLCFAFMQRRAVVDANVIRLLSRYFGLTSGRARARTDKDLWKAAYALVPTERCREYNWAIFDFAAEICQAEAPRCGECPLRRGCSWFARQREREQT